jgi:hypothetical protein
MNASSPVCPQADSMDDAIEMKMRLYSEKPLVMYIFSNKRALVNKLESAIPSGAVVVNDCIMHAGSHYLPFGGVGQSGLGESKGAHATHCICIGNTQLARYIRTGIVIVYSFIDVPCADISWIWFTHIYRVLRLHWLHS